MTNKERDLVLETIDLLRETTRDFWEARGIENPDWKDIDDWIFSNLNWTKSRLIKMYKNRPVSVYIDAAIDDLD